MSIAKPAPWAYDPALTRLPAISALLGAAYPFLEGAGATTREYVSGVADVDFRQIPTIGSATSPNPSFTAQRETPSGDFVRIITITKNANAGVALQAYFSPDLTQAASDWVTDPAHRYALICQPGADFNVKPAAWAWDIGGLDPSIPAEVITKLVFLAPHWVTGPQIDLISGSSAPELGGFMPWGTIAGVSCILADGIGGTPVRYWPAGATWVPAEPFSYLAVRVTTGDPEFEMRGQLYKKSSELVLLRQNESVLGWYADPGDVTGPSLFSQTSLDHVYGDGEHSFAMSQLSRGVLGAWSVDGSYPQRFAWSVVDGASAMHMQSSPSIFKSGLANTHQFSIRVMTGGFTPLEAGTSSWSTLCGGQSSTDGNQWFWIAPNNYVGYPQQIMEVEVASVDPTDPDNSFYRQFDFALPDDFDFAAPHFWEIDRPNRDECSMVVDGVSLTHVEGLEENAQETTGVDFPPPSDRPIDGMYLADASIHFDYLEYLGFPLALTGPQSLALRNDRFGAVAPAVAAGVSRPRRNPRRLCLL